MSGIGMSLLAAANPLRVTASDAIGQDSGFGQVGTVTASTTASATGGVGPYSFSWARVSGSTGPVISSATAQSPFWTADVSANEPEEAVWRVTVTDSVGATATFNITVSLTWISFD